MTWLMKVVAKEK